jgi:Flp pilus assembly protein TadG
MKAARARESGQAVAEVMFERFPMDLRLTGRRSNRRGASAVEFAIVAPVFFLLIFGMIEYGRLVMVQQILTNAAREGARRAVLQDATSAAVVSTVRNYLNRASINGNSPNLVITVSPAPESAQPSDETISVSLRLPYREVSWLPSPFFLGSTYMNAMSVMRRETF